MKKDSIYFLPNIHKKATYLKVKENWSMKLLKLVDATF